MARSSFVRRTIRRVLRGTSWFQAVGRYNDRFPQIFRTGKWRPSSEGSLWMTLFGMKAGPLSLVGKRRGRNSMARLLRVEGLEQKNLLAANVFVNDNWVELIDNGGTPGTVETGDVVINSGDVGEPATGGVFGTTAFSTIQDGIDNTDPGGTTNVLLGSYAENLTISDSLHLSGAGQSKVSVVPGSSGPGVGETGSLPAGAVSMVLVQADDVEISGITFDGDNTALTSGASVGGADIDARNGIITDHNTVATVLNLNVHDVTVENIYLRGIQSSAAGSFTFTDNVVNNVQGDAESLGIANVQGGSGTISGNVVDGATTGISTNFSLGTTITGNTVRNSLVGIASSNNDGTGANTADVIGGPGAGEGNLIEDGLAGSTGILIYMPYLDVIADSNTVNDVSVGLAAIGGAGGSATFLNNTVSRSSDEAGSIGALVSNDDFEPTFPQEGPTAAALLGNTISGFETGIVAEELVSATANTDTSVAVTSGSVSGGVTGLVLDGELAVAGNTLGSLALSGQSGDYITLTNGALDDGDLNATAVTFDGKTGAAMNAAERIALEDKLLHEPDDDTLGLIQVDATNDAPTFTSVAIEDATEDAVYTYNITTEDVDGDSVTITSVLALPGWLTLIDNNDGTATLSGTPTQAEVGDHAVDLEVSDGTLSSTQAFIIAVANVNDAPVAVDDDFTTDEDTPLSDDVLANDTDDDGDTLTVTLGTDVANGTLVLNPDGTFTYTPNADFTGSDSFTYTANDGTADSNEATVTITVGPVNDAPVAVDDDLTTDEDVPLVGSVTASDADADTLTFAAVDLPTNGTLVLNSDGSFTYTPDADFNGADSFTFTANDGTADSNVATVNITVNPINDAPVANDDNVSTAEDTPFVGDVTTNDDDAEGDTLTVTLGTDVANGTLVLNADGTFTYTPAANFSGADSFTYTANDGTADSNEATVTIDVGVVNDAPIAVGESVTTDEDSPIAIALSASDADGDALTFMILTPPTNGTLGPITGSSVTYTPGPNFNGADSFTFKANDGTADSNVAVVSITVTAINDPPDAVDDNFGVDEDSGATVIDVLANDTDPEGDDLTVTDVGTAPNGTVTLEPNGTVSYTPAPGFAGTDSFTYTIEDESGAEDTATVTVTVGPLNDAPTVANEVDDVVVDEDAAPTVIDISDVFDDADGDTLAITVVSSNPTLVTPALAGDDLTLTFAANQNGAAIITLTADDGNGGTVTESFDVTVNAINDVPTVENSLADITVDEDDPPTVIDISGVFEDVDAGDNLTITVESDDPDLVTPTISGTDLTLTYGADENGVAIITLTATDEDGEAVTESFNVTVNAINDAPVAVDDIALVDEDSAAQIIDVLANDSDADGDTLVILDVGTAAHGTVEIVPAGPHILYTPDAGYTGPDSFTYTISDGNGGESTATVNITVGPVNDPPMAEPDDFTTDEDTAVTGNVLDNDTDEEGDALTATVATSPADGTLAFNADGSFTYTPNADFNGSDSFTYTVDDGAGGTDTGLVTITVASVEDAPNAVDDSYKVTEDKSLNVPAPGVLGNDTDGDSDALTAALDTDVSNGTLVFNADGSFTYTPDASFSGTDSFTYTVDDGDGDTDTAKVTITVEGVNDAPTAADDVYMTDENTPISDNVLINDTDPDGDTLTATLGSSPMHGTLTFNADGSFTYTPDTNFSGPDTFSYQVSDGNGGTDTATVTINVANINIPPDAKNDEFTTDENTPLSGNVLSNDSDADGDPLSATLVTGPSSGTLVLNSNGNFTYTPDPAFEGEDEGEVTFTYRASDGLGGIDTATVTITITPVDDAPVAVDDAFTTDEDVPVGDPVVANVLENDLEFEGDDMTATLATGPAHGSLVFNADGSFIYTPALNFNGNDSFTYTVSSSGGSDTGTVTITIDPVNDVDAVDDSFSTPEGKAVSKNVLANDFDAEGDPLTAALETGPSDGTLVFNTDGSFTYTPDPDFQGKDTFTYTASDDQGGSDTATVTINVTDVNDAPVANDDSDTVNEDTTNNVIDVLVNDTDIDGDKLTVIAVTTPAHGTATIGGGGIRYTPAPNFVGTDEFKYTVSDGRGGTDTATVTITVENVEDVPSPVDDSFTRTEDTVVTLTAAQLTDNDFNPDNDPLTITSVSNPSNGTVVLNGDGTVTFTPALNFTGAAGFDYEISGGAEDDTGRVTITFTPVNDAPVVGDDTFDTDEDTALVLDSSDLLENDSDPEGNTLTVTAVHGATDGTVTLDSKTGEITFTPEDDFVGTAGFDYTVSDGVGGSNTGHVTVNVADVNESPEAEDDVANTDEDTPVTIDSEDLLDNDSDPDGDDLTLTAVSNATNGTVTLDSKTGDIKFTPAANFAGEAGFDYKVSDGRGGDDIGHVKITVDPIPDPPTANDDTVTVVEDTKTEILVLTNDTDPDAKDELKVIAVGTPANGAVSIGPAGVFYTPNPDFVGNDSFTYTISDLTGNEDTATVSVTVAPEGDAPNADDDKATVNEDSVNNVVDVLDGDTDPEGDPLKVTAVTQGTNGTAQVGPDGKNVLYTPDPNFFGTDTFTYTVSDPAGNTDTATVTVTVNNVNEPPDAVDDTADVVEESGPNVIDVLDNDSDSDGGTLTITKVTQGSNGTVEIRPGGADLVYTPNANFAGTDTFTYTVSDGQGGTDTATVTVDVGNTNDAPNAEPDAATVNEDSTNNAIDVLGNDTDPDGDTLTVTAVTASSNGTVSVGSGGTSVLYTPNVDFVGTDTFTYTITDGNGGTDTATVTVTVTDVDADFVGTAGDDVFYVRLDATGTDIRVFNNDTGTGTPIFSQSLASTPSLSFNTLAGDDRLIVDSINGNPIPSGGILYLGGGNTAAGDRLSLRNSGIANGSYTGSSTTTGSGVVNVGNRAINMTGVEPIDVTAFNNFTVVTPGAADTLTITRPATDTIQLAGASGGVALSPVTLNSVSNFIIDAATNDGGGGSDSLTIDASGTVPNNVGFLQYRAGTGTNMLAIADGSVRIDSTMAAGGTLNTTVATGAELLTHRFRQSSLTLADDSRAIILADGTDNGTSVLTGLTIGEDATLDISDNALIVDYTGATSPENTIRAKILEGRDGIGVGNGAWTGTGITSSSAAAANALNPESRSVGYGDNGTMPLYSYDVFRGQAVDKTAILITFTRTADADLNGIVDDNDVTVIGAIYAPGVAQPRWALGDFDFNGFVDDNDVTLLGAFYDPNAEPYDSSIPAPAPLAAAGDGDAHAAVFAGMADGSAGTSQDSGRSLSAADLAAIADEIFADSDDTANRKTRFGV